MRSQDRFYEREADGSVIVQVEVDAQGKPGEATVVHNNLGKRYGINALRAIRLWRFEPARRDGVAVASTVQVPIAFDLRQPTIESFWGDAVRHPVAGTSPLGTVIAAAGSR